MSGPCISHQLHRQSSRSVPWVEPIKACVSIFPKIYRGKVGGDEENSTWYKIQENRPLPPFVVVASHLSSVFDTPSCPGGGYYILARPPFLCHLDARPVVIHRSYI